METSLREPARQRGVALPIALIMFVMMLVTSIYMMRSSSNSALMAGNLAYERTLSRSADYGLSIAFDWLNTTASLTATKGQLNSDQAANGYVSNNNPAISYRDTAYWAGSRTITDPGGTSVEYVIHRLCQYGAQPYNGGPPDFPFSNVCVQSTPSGGTTATGARTGESLASDASSYGFLPEIHYVITARVPGLKGAGVVNQFVVMIGA